MPVSISREGVVAIVTVDNPPVNALAQPVRQALWDTVEALDADASVHSVVLICAGRTFIAGADVSEFGRPPMPPHLPDLVSRIEAATKPWIAAIHGSALGGGFEIALGCRFRVALASASIGLPEVTLGIVPGAGGTVRTPRLAGVEAAIDLVTTGKPIRAPRAKALGLVDAIYEEDLLAAAISFAENVVTRQWPASARERLLTPQPTSFWEENERAVAKRSRGEDAPLRALACIRQATESDFSSALAFEREIFLTLRGSAQATALRHVFFAERAASRPAELKGVEPRPIRQVGVIGGGTMGAGIAATLRDAGLPVVLIERDEAALQRGLANLRGIFEAAAKRGRIAADDVNERMAGVTGSTDETYLSHADMVIEAVFEDLAVKKSVFARLGEVCRPDAILATNTSYLDPQLIAAELVGPERFIGLHFFSPAQIMKLLEIVPTADTAPQAVATGFALARMLGKIPVRAGICDGFIGNRLLKTTRMQAERVLLSGGSPSQVDAAMRAFGMSMGPFEAQDLAGLDIAAFQRKAARGRGEAPFAPVAERLCALGRFGQKAGGGWYDYGTGSRQPQPSNVVADHIAAAAAEAGLAPRSWSNADIVDAIVLPMVNEGAKILEDRVALRPADIDLVEIHGYGFPRWRGGLMHWAEARGLPDVVGMLDRLAELKLAEPVCELLRCSTVTGRLPTSYLRRSS
ncbi:3-hydroxyacyl-CoA dehydrogenase NAD-binding domain-containing protein [Microvirga terricola]|uniref:3-hydroxyacyl-CoA dehydrogenase n=1 Tax=Microvirga terricola TaxID=2719797 RepID=A0ABX0V821_9HYPH|nr:3-hydroxyacyl-CoA dehydrogenase NAD-binding domain-containing protein [Microvirga terricola]NIX75883.1 3-hydroxyacyl-CoA dehydrogenase [Microvirga terricola]